MATSGGVAERLRNGVGSARRAWRRLIDHPLPWLLPTLLALAVFQLYPMVEAIRMSFTNESLVSAGTEFVGLEQYVRLATDPVFWEMLRVTAVYAFSSVVLHVLAGLVLALAIDYGVRRGLRGHLTTRVSVLLAWIIPGIIIGLVWKVMLVESQFGAVNHLLGLVDVGPVPFRSDPTFALVSTIVAGTWRGTAFSMIMIYGGLQRVPERLYEAARIDGAGRWERFRHVTIPQLKSVVFITTVLVTIYALNTFDLIFALTGGGPGRATQVLALFMYQEAFQDYALGRGAAIAVVMLTANLLLTGVYLYAFDVREEL
ncbi:MAG: sugar ABC transporter permease [Haloarculaceae archaeon]